MSKRIAAAAAALLSVAAAHSAAAQSAKPAGAGRTGFFGAAYLAGTSVKDDVEGADQESGGGISLQAGYGFKNNLAVFVDLSGAKIDSKELDGNYSLAHLDVGARYTWALQSKWAPFAEVAVGARAAGAEVTLQDESGETMKGDLSMSGSTFSIGGGTHYYLSPSLGLSADLRVSAGKYTKGKFEDQDFDIDQKSTSSRLNLGVVWFPKAK